ncbi:A-kinase anchor protein 5 [Rhea pennata]|uniref:A-kinase anchor protein 5 n=1 Tax=Rhea pennata TaxID=8795 RepID=UPI002E266815
MAKAAREIQMESAGEPEAPSAAAACSAAEQGAEKPSVLCFKKRKASCKRALEASEGDRGADPGEEAKGAGRSRSAGGAWAALKSLARPRHRGSKSRRKKAPAAGVEEEAGPLGSPGPRGGSGCTMPCLRRRPRGGETPSASEVAEESDGSARSGNLPTPGGEPAASAQPAGGSVAERPRQLSMGKEDMEAAAESAGAAGKSEPPAEPGPGECVGQPGATDPAAASKATQEERSEGSPCQNVADRDEDAEEAASEAATRETAAAAMQEMAAVGTTHEMATATQEMAATMREMAATAQEMAATTQEMAAVAMQETAAATTTREMAATQEMAATHVAPPDGADPGVGAEEAAEAEPPAPWAAGAGIVITVTAAAESDDDDKDDLAAAHEASPALRRRGQAGAEEERGGGQRQGEGPGGRAAEQRERLLVETASSLVKAAIQASVEQLLNEMALEQRKQNSFL